MVKRRIDDLLLHLKFLHRTVDLAQICYGTFLELDVDLHTRILEKIEDLLEFGDQDLSELIAPCAAEIIGAERLEICFKNLCLDTACHTLDIVIVMDNESAVRGLINIQLDAVRLHIDRKLKRLERVFRCIRRSTSVCPNLCFHRIAFLPKRHYLWSYFSWFSAKYSSIAARSIVSAFATVELFICAPAESK